MPSRSSSAGRFSAWTFVAPVVLLVAVLVVVNVLQDALADNRARRTTAAPTAAGTTDGTTDGAATTAPTGASDRPTTTGQAEPAASTAARAPQTYVVRSGDTLGAIAERFGTSTQELRDLNPELDPNAMQPGDRVRVSR